MNVVNKWLLGVVSASAIAGASLWEGTRYTPYRDVGGVPTVCQGHTGRDIDMTKVYTKEECKTFLVNDLKKHSDGIYQCVNVPINQNEFDAYTIFAFNVGVGAACKSLAIRTLNAGNHSAACNRIATGPDGKPVWSYVEGKYVQGLQNRRQWEKALCLKPVQ